MKLLWKETYTCTFNAASAPKQDIKSSMPFANALIIPFWLVRTTDDPSHANMQHATFKSIWTMSIGKEEAQRTTVTIPIMQNSRLVNVGEELLALETNTVQEKRPATIEPESEPSKKARRS